MDFIKKLKGVKIIDKYRYTIPTNHSNLRIGLLGYDNSSLSIEGVRQLANNNKDFIDKYNISACRAFILFKDGSIIESITSSSSIRGKKYDQLILFDDNRWLIKRDEANIIQEIINKTMYASKVDPEWQIIYYEDIRR